MAKAQVGHRRRVNARGFINGLISQVSQTGAGRLRCAVERATLGLQVCRLGPPGARRPSTGGEATGPHALWPVTGGTGTHAGPAVLPGGRRRSQGPTLSALLGHLQSDRDGPTAQGTGWHEASSDSPQGMEAGVLSTGHAKPEPRGGWAPGHRLCPPHCSVRQPGHRCPAQVGGGCPGPGCWWPRGEAARWPLEGCPAPAAAPRAWPPHRAGLPRAGRGCSGGGVSLASLCAPAAPIPDPAPPPRGGSAGGHKAKHGLAFHELAHTHHLVKIRRIVPDPQGN